MENRIASSNKLGLVLPDIAQLVERSTVDRLVTCSNQVVGNDLILRAQVLKIKHTKRYYARAGPRGGT